MGSPTQKRYLVRVGHIGCLRFCSPLTHYPLVFPEKLMYWALTNLNSQAIQGSSSKLLPYLGWQRWNHPPMKSLIHWLWQRSNIIFSLLLSLQTVSQDVKFEEDSLTTTCVLLQEYFYGDRPHMNSLHSINTYGSDINLQVPLSMSMESHPSVFILCWNIHPGSECLGRNTQNHREYK